MKRMRSLENKKSEVDLNKKQQLMVDEDVSTLVKPKMATMLALIAAFSRQNSDSFVWKDITKIILQYCFQFDFMIRVSSYFMRAYGVWEIKHGINMKNIFAHNKKFILFVQSNGLLVFDSLAQQMYQLIVGDQAYSSKLIQINVIMHNLDVLVIKLFSLTKIIIFMNSQ